jgi:hypothetical protein
LKKQLASSWLITLVLAAVPAYADLIAVDGTWHEFQFELAGSFTFSCGGGGCDPTVTPVAEETSSPPWTFSGPATVTSTDLFQRGDQFALFDNAALVGDTSVPVNDGATTCPGGGNNILGCLSDPTYSHGLFTLGAGAHSLTIEDVQNASGTTGGAAVFQVSAVPEVSSVSLLGSVLVALSALRLRRRCTK